jgi:hypothetical protein
MNISRRGLGGGAKAGIVVVAVVIILAAAYELPSLTKGSSPTTSTVLGSVANVGANGGSGMYAMVKSFSQMQVQVNSNDVPDGINQTETLSYRVLGAGTINSTEYTRVEFSTIGAGPSNDVIAWFNSTGGLGRVDVLGERNYTGNGVPNLPFISNYVNTFQVFPNITNNATLFATLVPSSNATTSIGSMKAVVTTYLLDSPNKMFANMEVKVATFTATNQRMAVYVYERQPEPIDSSSTLQIQSLSP